MDRNLLEADKEGKANSKWEQGAGAQGGRVRVLPWAAGWDMFLEFLVLALSAPGDPPAS